MLTKDIIDKILTIYRDSPQETVATKGFGWVNLAKLGSPIRKAGIDYKALGYEKISYLFKDIPVFELTEYIKDGNPPIIYIREKRIKNRRIEKGNTVFIKSNDEPINLTDNLFSLPVIGKYYKELIDDAEFGWPEIVGLYEINEHGQYQISDIRDLLFHEHKYPSIDNKDSNRDIIILLDGPLNTLKPNNYYRFNWCIKASDNARGYIIDIDKTKQPKRIVPSLFIENLHKLWDDKNHGRVLSDAMSTISSELMSSSDGTFIYELLQNANDYPTKDEDDKAVPVEVEFHLTDKCLICRHSGAKFSPRDVSGICSIGNGSKTKNKNTIGYKGIGFKTVFHLHDWVYIKSGEFMFRFDKNSEKEGRPFQIMPIWTTIPELNEFDDTVANLIKGGMDKFNVQTVMLPRKQEYLYGMEKNRQSEKSHEYVLRDMFKDIRDIVFIPNIKSVTIFFPGEEPIVCSKSESSDWVVSEPYRHVLDEETERAEIIKECNEHPERRIPPKYKTFEDTYVSFAAKKCGNNIEIVDHATVYCYLPTKAEFGFPFLMNTDMVPSGDRNQLKTDVKFNALFAKIAGQKFFIWINDLIKSGDYDLDSIFALIPNFEECLKITVYKDFIEAFQKEFEDLIQSEAFVPINSTGHYALLSKIIYDTTGISESGIMTDDELLSFVDGQGVWTRCPDEFFVHSDLRGKPNFHTFLTKYHAENMGFSQETILTLCESEEFNKWLKIQSNNNNFLKFLISYGHLKKFIENNKRIFIDNNGNLCSANELYYEVDKFKESLPELSSYIPHLSHITRKFIEENQLCDYNISDCFNKFSISEAIENHIISNDKAMSLLRELTTSVPFYRYLAVNGVDLKSSNEIPYITENGAYSTDYVNPRYFYSDDAYALTKEKWLGNNVVQVLNHEYFSNLETEAKNQLTNVFSRLGFTVFEQSVFIDNYIVGNSDFQNNINAIIESDFTINRFFCEFVYKHGINLKEGSLKKYVLRCVDIKGKDVYLCSDNVRYFDQEAYTNNSSYSDNTGHPWLKEDMMYAISNAYFNVSDDDEKKKIESFLRQQFGIKTFTDKSFSEDVVFKNRDQIYNTLTTDKQSLLAFLKYLIRDSERIFDRSFSFDKIESLPLLCYDGTIKQRAQNVVYLEFSEDAKELIEKEWFSGNYILLDPIYTKEFSLEVRRLFKFEKFEIKTLCGNILSNIELKKSANTKEYSVDFWRWVLNNRKDINDYNQLDGYYLLNKDGKLFLPSCFYIPDAYQKEKIESLVSRYVENAQFVSSQYLESDTDEEKAKWVKLFKKLGLKSDNKDILFSDILPNLASFEGNQADSVVAMMTKHLKDLKEDWDARRKQVIQLRVKTQSNVYKPLSEVLIANVDLNTTTEPFKYIALSNEIASDILEANRDILFLIAKEFNNVGLISSKKSWIETKIKEYLHLFETNSDSVSEIHVKFVRELAKLLEDYEINNELLSRVKYHTKKGKNDYLTAEEITLGSIYNPVCDFEANGITELTYLSEEYFFEGNKDSIKTFFKGLGMHHNMMRKDLKYLSNRTFACYFWAKCFSRRLTEYNSWIEEGLFDGINCIPTRHAVRKAEELYAPSVTGFAVKAHVPNWEEKVAAKEVVDSIDNLESRTVFEKLKFTKALSFEDCLYYLARVEHKRDDESIYRSCVINWLLTAPYNEDKVNEYRNTPTSVWRNGKGQKKHITELYAIHPNAEQQRSIFRGNEFVIQTGAFPKDADSFVKACQILKIQCLTSEDFVAKPINYTDETKELIAILRPRLLVLAAIENPDRFQELYTKYNEVLSKYHFCVCEKIDLGYDTIHNDVERIYNDDSHIYYVASWKHNRTFTKFCGRLKNLIDLKIYDDICEDVFDDTVTVEDCIEKYCSSLKYDEQFRSYMKSLDLFINITPDVEDEPSEDDTPYYEDAKETEVDQSNETDAEEQNSDSEDLDDEDTNSEVTDRDTDEPGSRQGVTDTSEIVPEQTSPSEPDIDDSKSECHGDAHSGQHIAENHEPSDTESESLNNEEDEEDTNIVEDEHQIEDDELDEYVQEGDAIEDESYEDSVEDSKGTSTEPNKKTPHQTGSTIQSDGHGYDPDYGDYMGSVDKDGDYQPVGEQPNKPRRVRKHLKNYTKPEIERLRSHGTPLELESLPPTQDELDILAECNITPEQIADTNYLAQLRLYQNLVDRGDKPEESLEEFVRNADDVTTHKLSGGKYIHTCSAARGVMYISPSVWNKMVDDEWEICVYLDGQGKNFHYIKTRDEFLQLVEKDDVVIKITGKEKVDVVNRLYSDILSDVKGAAYTLVRVAARTNMDAVFAHYVGAMAEADDGNDENEYGE